MLFLCFANKKFLVQKKKKKFIVMICSSSVSRGELEKSENGRLSIPKTIL